MSRLSQRRGYGEAQVVSLSVMEGGWKPDPRRIGEMGAKSENFKKKDWKWHRGIATHPLNEMSLGQESVQCEDMGV